MGPYSWLPVPGQKNGTMLFDLSFIVEPERSHRSAELGSVVSILSDVLEASSVAISHNSADFLMT